MYVIFTHNIRTFSCTIQCSLVSDTKAVHELTGHGFTIEKASQQYEVKCHNGKISQK